MSLEDLERGDGEPSDYDIGFQDRAEGRTSDYRLERRLGLGGSAGGFCGWAICPPEWEFVGWTPYFFDLMQVSPAYNPDSPKWRN